MSQSQDDWKPCVCPVDFDRVNQVALTRSHELIRALLPGGVTSVTQCFIPRRKDLRLISIFLDSGRWSDFALVAHGDDIVGLVAHVFDLTRRGAIRRRRAQCRMAVAAISAEARGACGTNRLRAAMNVAASGDGNRLPWLTRTGLRRCWRAVPPGKSSYSRERHPGRPEPRQAL
jgi:hypothetical protein